MFPSPYLGYHLSTVAYFINPSTQSCFRPLIWVIIFQQIRKLLNTNHFIYRFRPLIWVIIFQRLDGEDLTNFGATFPSPYLGYHLSTLLVSPLVRLLSLLFPSPYLGYHLSTLPLFSPYSIRLSRGFSVPKI